MSSLAATAGTTVDINPGQVTTAAGNATSATLDGSGTSAEFKTMGGSVVLANSGTGLYTDAYQATEGSIRAIDLSAGPVAVTTLAGDPTATGCVDSSTPSSVRFSSYSGLGQAMGSMDSDGTYLYVYDGSCGIRKVALSGATSTLTTSANGPLTVGPDGYVYVAGNAFVYKVDPTSGSVSTYYTYASNYSGAISITSDATYLWLIEAYTPSSPCGNNLLRIKLSDGSTTSFTAAGSCSSMAGSGQLVSAGNYLYVSGAGDTYLERITKADGTVIHIAGTNATGYTSAAETGTDAWFSQLSGLASDGSSLWAADQGNHRLRKVVDDTALPSAQPPLDAADVDIYPGTVTTVAGNATSATVDGTGTSAEFKKMGGSVILADPSTSDYTDGYQATEGSIRAIDLSGGSAAVSTLAGDATATGCMDSTNPSSARFSTYSGLGPTMGSMDSDGYYLYVYDGTCGIRRVSLSGATSTLTTSVNGPLTVGPDGYIYVSELNTGIQRVDPINGTVSPFYSYDTHYSGAISITSDATYLWLVEAYTPSAPCGNILMRIKVSDGSARSYRAAGTCSSMAGSGQLVSAGSYLYTSGPGNANLERITKRTGVAASMAGSSSGYADAEWADAHFSSVTGLASDGVDLWAADTGNHRMRRIVFAPLRAREIGGRGAADGSIPSVTSGDPINTVNGDFSEAFTDIAMPGIGTPFTFTRYYSSAYAAMHRAANRFGSAGWTDNLESSVEPTAAGGALVSLPTGGTLTFVLGSGGSLDAIPGEHDSLDLSGGQYTLTRFDGSVYDYNVDGRLSGIEDRNGNSLSLYYDVSGLDGRLDHVIDTVGRQIDFGYDPYCGSLSAITLPDGRYVEYAYNGDCQISTSYELDADGLSRKSTTYGWSGSMLSYIDRGNGHVMDNTYASEGRVNQQTLPTGPSSATTTTYAYSAGTTTATRNGNTWSYLYDVEGRLQSVTDPYSTVVTYTYSPSGADPDQPTHVSKPGGRSWDYHYVSNGMVDQITPPVGGTRYIYYSTTFPDLVTSASDGVGNWTMYSYDANGNLVCRSKPVASNTTACNLLVGSLVTSVSYDSNNQLHTVTDPNGSVTTYDHFGSTSSPQKKGLLQTVTTQEHLTTSYDYNSYLQQTSMLTPQGYLKTSGSYTWSYTYDDANRLLSVTDPVSSSDTTSYTYDLEGNLLTRTDADGHITSYDYLPGGIQCDVQLGSGADCAAPPLGSTSYSYDADGNLSRVTDGDWTSGASHATAYTYWNNGELKTVADGAGLVWSYAKKTYASATSSLIETLPSGDTATSTFDAMERVTTLSYTTPTATGLDATPTHQFAYDDNSNLCNAALGTTALSSCTINPAGDTGDMQFQYNTMNHMTNAGGFSYTYLDDGVTIKSRTYPNTNKVAYTYDGDLRLCGLVFGTTTPASTCTNGTINYNYSAYLNATSKITKSFPFGQTITTLDHAGRLAKLQNRTGSPLTDESTFDPTLDAAGFPVTVAAVNNGLATALISETQTYTFDSTTARLKKVCYDSGGACGSGANVTGEAFTYDGTGNITKKVVTGGGSAGTTNYAYNGANGLCYEGSTTSPTCSTGGGTTYTYTANGDRRSDGSLVDRYDLAGRLTQAKLGTTYTDNYSYDVLGNRATGAASATYVWDSNASVAQLATESNGATHNYFYGGGLEATKSGTPIYYYDRDQTGSVVNFVKDDGTLEYSYSYQPYGAFRSNKKNNTGFTTNFNPMTFDSEYKDTGTTGFMDLRARSFDPGTGGFLQPDPIGETSSYAFASGNPTMLSDPSGKSICGGSCTDLFKELSPNHWRQDYDASSHSDKVAGLIVGAAVAACIVACAEIVAAISSSALATATAAGAGYGAVSGSGAYLLVCGVSENLACTPQGLLGAAVGGAITGAATGFGAEMFGASLGVAFASGFLGGLGSSELVSRVVCHSSPTLGEDIFSGFLGGAGGAAGTEVVGRSAGSSFVRGFGVDAASNAVGGSC